MHFSAFGQTYTISWYGDYDGLPSNYIYNTVQDDAGLLWIATEAGLSTFDGNTFRTDLFPELFAKEVIQIIKDNKGRLWLNTLSGEVFYLEGGTLEQLDYPQQWPKSRNINLCLDGIGHLWLSEKTGVKTIGIDLEDLEAKYNFESTEEHISFLNKSGLLANDQSTKILDGKLDFEQEGSVLPFLNINTFFSNALVYDEDKILLTHEHKMYSYDNSTFKLTRILEEYQSYLDHKIIHFNLDNHNNLWIATKNGFVRIQDPISKYPQIKEYFTYTRGASVSVDNQNNIWISTLGKGLAKLSESNICTTIDSKGNSITCTIFQGDYVIYGTNKGEIAVLDNYNEEIFRQKFQSETSFIYDLKPWKDNSIIAISENSIKVLDLEKMELSPLKEIQNLKSVSVYDDHIWVTSGHGTYTTGQENMEFNPLPPFIRSYTCLPVSDTEAYIGSINGLYKTNAVHKTTQQILPNIITEDIRTITRAADSTLWLGTFGNGVYVLYKDSLIHHHLSKLPSRFINDIESHGESMWVATTNGLSKIDKHNGNYVYKILNKHDGMVANDITSIDINSDKNSLSLCAGVGVSNLELDIKFNNDVPILKINTVKINERDTTILAEYDLDKNQRNVKISYSGILFNNPISVEYKYKMEGVDNDWVLTSQNEAQYPSLAPGQYNFMLQAKSANSVWSDFENIKISIPQYFIESKWFYILILLLACTLSILGFLFFTNARNRKRKLKLSQMAALRAQMNPHFIFNSLNSVQDYVLRDDKRAANKYISRFSKLMRYILNASDNEFTSLEKELEALELYLSIESMRFDNTLVYNIEVDSELDPSKYQIPTMIVQPYAENAIKHGLMHATGDKKLQINVKKYEAGLVFEIIDNGIGRANSEKIKLMDTTTYASKGTLINQRRIELLNRTYQKQNKVTFEDIFDKHNNPSGTKVDIFLQSIKYS